MSARPLPWLIAYDVRSPRRLARLHRWLSRLAAPVQYSVFIGRFDPDGIDSLCAGIRGIIDEREDDVRLYPLPEGSCMTLLGRQRAPDGWSLIDAMNTADTAQHPLEVDAWPAEPDTVGQVVDRHEEKDP